MPSSCGSVRVESAGSNSGQEMPNLTPTGHTPSRNSGPRLRRRSAHIQTLLHSQLLYFLLRNSTAVSHSISIEPQEPLRLYSPCTLQGYFRPKDKGTLSTLMSTVFVHCTSSLVQPPASQAAHPDHYRTGMHGLRVHNQILYFRDTKPGIYVHDRKTM